jgi:hypothetical protein
MLVKSQDMGKADEKGVSQMRLRKGVGVGKCS